MSTGRLVAVDATSVTVISSALLLSGVMVTATLTLLGKRGETRVSAGANLVAGQLAYIGQVQADNAELRAELVRLRDRVGRLEAENEEVPTLRAEVAALRAENTRLRARMERVEDETGIDPGAVSPNG